MQGDKYPVEGIFLSNHKRYKQLWHSSTVGLLTAEVVTCERRKMLLRESSGGFAYLARLGHPREDGPKPILWY
jgi:hypothetical protein